MSTCIWLPKTKNEYGLLYEWIGMSVYYKARHAFGHKKHLPKKYAGQV